MFMSILNHAAYYPSLVFNLIRNKAGPTDWPWYSRIDQTVILGALPFKSMVNELVDKENVGGVVCLTMPHEVNNLWAAGKADFEAKGVKYHWLPVADFCYDVKCEDLHEAVQFIRQFENTGKSVYVHCKAGRARSAVTVICYLMEVRETTPFWRPVISYVMGVRPCILREGGMKLVAYRIERNKWYSPAAFTMIKPKRPQVALRGSHWSAIEQYSKAYLWGSSVKSDNPS